MPANPKLRHLAHTPIQAFELEKATWRGQLRDPGLALVLGDSILNLVQDPRVEREPDMAGPVGLLNRGGTLQAHQVEKLRSISGDFKGAIDDVTTELSDLTGGQFRTAVLKSYNPNSKKGLGPHRDSNFDAPESLIAMTSILGMRDSALWAVPQSLYLEGKDDGDFMRSADRRTALERMRGKLGTDRVELTPFSVLTQKPGDVTMIDERPEFNGTWEDPKLHTMAAWHSVYGNFDPAERGVPGENLVVSMISRTQDPAAHIPNKS